MGSLLDVVDILNWLSIICTSVVYFLLFNILNYPEQSIPSLETAWSDVERLLDELLLNLPPLVLPAPLRHRYVPSKVNEHVFNVAVIDPWDADALNGFICSPLHPWQRV